MEAETKPWNKGVRGTQVLPLINSEAKIIRVDAGPGTGKTFGLARRILRLLHPEGEGLDGERILIVAFNRVIAKQLKTEILQLLADEKVLEKPEIMTVHALCLKAIGKDIRLLMPHERSAMLYDVLHDNPKLVERYKRQPAAEQALKNHEAGHTKDMALWQGVDRWLNRHKARLISDLPGLLLDCLKAGDAAGERYDHIIVDEFQDLTAAEQKLITKLLAPDGSIVALGDPRQSIYAFRGNDREGLAKLESLLGVESADITNVPMTECQRCPADIVKAANQLMSGYASLQMEPLNEQVANTHVVVWDTPDREITGMAAAIAENMHKYPKKRHLAMVTRREFGYALRDALAKSDPSVVVDLSFSEGLLETWPVREAFLFFCLLADPDSACWRSWLGYRNSVDGTNFEPDKRNAPAYLNLLRGFSDTINEGVIFTILKDRNLVKGVGGSNLLARAERYAELRGTVSWDKDSAHAMVSAVLDAKLWITKATVKLDTARQDFQLLVGKAHSLVDEYLDEDPNLQPVDVLRKVAQSIRYHIATREPFVIEEEGALKVTTLWSAKGITADHVYVIGLCEQALPGNERDDYPGSADEHREEQRRLFYVSITRATTTLVLSRARQISSGAARKLGLWDGGAWHWLKLGMSPFLRDIMDYLPGYVDGEKWSGCLPPSTLPTSEQTDNRN